MNGLRPSPRPAALVSCLLSPVSWRTAPDSCLLSPVSSRAAARVSPNHLRVFAPSCLTGRRPPDSRASARAGFTMIEVLFAIMILALGLVMVAASFPVAIKWTRQDTNKTIGRLIATNALGIIETEYTPTYLSGVPTTGQLVPLAGVSTAPAIWPTLIDRTYAFGTPTPYPDPGTTANSLYFWTALIRQAPVQAPGASPPAQAQPMYDLYILVFKKGNLTDTYTGTSPAPLPAVPASTTASGGRLNTDGTGVPYVATGSLSDTTFPVGALGVDETTGAVFRKIITNVGGTNYVWRSDLPVPTSTPSYSSGPQADPVAYAPPTTNSTGQPVGTASPLIYIYTTTFTP